VNQESRPDSLYLGRILRQLSINYHLKTDAAKLEAHAFGLADPDQRSSHMASAVIFDTDGLRKITERVREAMP